LRVDSDLLRNVAISICNENGYTLHRELGGGAFKVAFLVANDEGSEFALKVIKEISPSARTSREVDAMFRCCHPCIARLVSLERHEFEGDTFQYMLEEYLGGGSLSSKIESDGYLLEDDAIRLGTHLIDALGHLYGLKLVHRDIKPDNIVFRSDGETPALVDFGLVRDLSATSLTQTWQQRGPGTPYFASPEQLNNEKHLIDWRSDQFSLGITLFFVKYGLHPYQYPDEPPFSRDTIERVANRGDRHPSFFETLQNTSLSTIIQLTEPWPVQRFRFPTDLSDAWPNS